MVLGSLRGSNGGGESESGYQRKTGKAGNFLQERDLRNTWLSQDTVRQASCGRYAQGMKAGETYDSLESMMSAHAAEAVRSAREDFRETLDPKLPATELVDRLERILNRLCPAPAPLDTAEGERLTLVWGGYFGELLRREFGGEWVMSVYPNSEFSVPTLEVRGSRLYPLLKVNRRLTLGAGEGLPGFYALIAARLGAAARPN